MKCKRCKVEKPLLDTGRCVGCQKYVEDYYENNREREIARARKSLRKKSRDEINIYKRELNRRNPLSICLQQARRRAKLNGLPFDLTLEDLEIPTKCPVLGIPLRVNDGHAKDDSYSLDRLIPELGYIKGNVTVISHKANTVKSNASIEELEKVLKWLKKECND